MDIILFDTLCLATKVESFYKLVFFVQRANRIVAEMDQKYTDNRLSHKLLEDEEENFKFTLRNMKRAAEKKVADDDNIIVVSDEETE